MQNSRTSLISIIIFLIVSAVVLFDYSKNTEKTKETKDAEVLPVLKENQEAQNRIAALKSPIAVPKETPNFYYDPSDPLRVKVQATATPIPSQKTPIVQVIEPPKVIVKTPAPTPTPKPTPVVTPKPTPKATPRPTLVSGISYGTKEELKQSRQRNKLILLGFEQCPACRLLEKDLDSSKKTLNYDFVKIDILKQKSPSKYSSFNSFPVLIVENQSGNIIYYMIGYDRGRKPLLDQILNSY